jgi:lysophospholipase L1-like esterase
MKHLRHLLRGSPRFAACAAWLLALASLQAAPTGPLTIVNAGRGGDTTGDLLARLEGEVLAHAPDLVILLAGTNDRLNSQKAVPLEQYAENMRRLVRQIRSRGTKVLLVTIPPAHGPYLLKRHPREFWGSEGAAARIAAVNEVVHRVALEHALPVVEFHAQLEKTGGASERADTLIRNAANSGSEDGVHPTAEGYRLLAGLVVEVILRENLQDARRIVCFGDSITRGVHVKGEGTATGETYPAFLLRALNQRQPQPSTVP